MDEAAWQAARSAMMLDPGVTNLNTGSWGPLPRPVFERATELRRQLADEPMNFILRTVPPLLWQARGRLADFLDTAPHRLAFTSNVSTSINLVASSLVLSAPGEILLTDHEYGAMHWCWERAAQRLGLTLRTFPLPTMAGDPAEVVEAATRAMTERTRLFFFSHVLSPTGLVLPARELCAEARKRGILTVVDGAHAAAMLPLDLSRIPFDFYGGNCHKWLLAPTGTGFLCWSEGNGERLRPLEVSWGYRHDHGRPDEPDEFGSTPRIRFLEMTGTRDFAPWLSVPAAIDFQAGLGWDRVRERIAHLARYVRDTLDGKYGLKLATPADPRQHGAMTAFRLPPGHDAQTLRNRMWNEHRIEAPIIERPEYLMVRVSTHFYTTTAEVDRLSAALGQILSTPA